MPAFGGPSGNIGPPDGKGRRPGDGKRPRRTVEDNVGRVGLQHIGRQFECRLDHCHSGDVAQGGFVTGWVDNAMATASMMGADGRVAMSLDVKVSFFRSANPGRVIAEGWVEHGGGRTVFAEGRLRTLEGVTIAKATSTIALLQPRKA